VAAPRTGCFHAHGCSCRHAGKRLKETNVMLNNMIEIIAGVDGSLSPLVLHASSVTEVPSGVCPTHAEWVDLWGEGKSFSAKHLFEFEMMTFLRRFALAWQLGFDA